MRQPTDSTIRNVQAVNKKLAKLAAEVKEVRRRIAKLEKGK